jgi:hypothetical protein
MFLLRFILLAFIFILIIRFIGRILFGVGRNTSNSFDRDSSSDQKRKEGEVYVNYQQDKKHKIIRKGEGEYIKYEEVDDE